MKKKKSLVLVCCVIIGSVWLAVAIVRHQSNAITRLPDGTEYELALVAFTNSYVYTRRELPEWAQPYARFIPDAIEKHLDTLTGGMSNLGHTSDSNLFVVFEARKPHGSAASPFHMRIRDDQGNLFDGNTESSVLASGDKSIQWILNVFPRRFERLYLQPLVYLSDGTWTDLGPFEIRNPRYGNYTQWRAQALPLANADNGTTAILELVESGTRPSRWTRGASLSSASPQSTRMVFSFAEDSKPVDHFRIISLSIADATGNSWPVDLFSSRKLAWTTNGVVEFAGGLWKGEGAWKIKMQALCFSGSSSHEYWEIPSIPIPSQRTQVMLTNQIQLGSLTVELGTIIAPGASLTNSWRSIGSYWGKEQSVYTLGLHFKSKPEDLRPLVIEAIDQNGQAVIPIPSYVTDDLQQALWLKVPAGAKELRLKLAFPQIKKFEFLAHPEFVGSTITR